jgi:outer membrane protein OmpA-like peptidoglycan-associated protein
MEKRHHFTILAFLAAVVALSFSGAVLAQDEDIDTSALEDLVPEEDIDESEFEDEFEGISEEFEDVDEEGEEEDEDIVEDEGEDEEEEEEGPKKGVSLQEGEWLEYPSTMGYSGLVRTMAATSGSPMSWSVGFNASFFVKKGFLYTDEVKDNHKRIQGAVHLRFTPIKYLELFLAVDSYANSTNIDIQNPRLFQTLGDTTFGVKGLYTVANLYTIALAIYPRFLNKVGDVGFEWKATSVTMMLAQTFDLKPSTNFPLRIHLNIGWDFNNSENLVKDREKAMTDAMPDEWRYQQYIMRFERFALNVNRNDYMLVGLAFDFTTPWVNPFLEWTLDVPINRQNFNCLQSGPAAFPDDDSCLDIEGFAAYPMDLAFGFRFQPPPVPGLSFLVAADVGLVGTKTHVREVPANPPYNIYFGASYSFAKKKETEVIEKETVKEVVKEVTPPPSPRILGKILDSETLEGIEGAVVTILDEEGVESAELNPIVTKPDGTFISYPLDAGTYQLGVKAEWYFDPIDCTVTLEETGDKETECKLRPMPKLATIKGKVTDAAKGDGLANVTVLISGAETKSTSTDSLGLFKAEVETGTYKVKGDLEGYFTKQIEIEAPAGESVDAQLQMSKKPKKDLVVIKKKKIAIRKKIQFEFDSAIIKTKSYVIVDAVADVLMNHPEITLVEIQGHTDDKGADDYNLDLSQRRAEAVRDYLIASGIDADRLIAKGYGETKPIAPNVTSKGRAKNRRVEFHILSQEGD